MSPVSVSDLAEKREFMVFMAQILVLEVLAKIALLNLNGHQPIILPHCSHLICSGKASFRKEFNFVTTDLEHSERPGDIARVEENATPNQSNKKTSSKVKIPTDTSRGSRSAEGVVYKVSSGRCRFRLC